LFSDTVDLSEGLEWTDAAGPGPRDYAAQLIDYVHGRGCSTVLPSDVLTIGDTMYLHVMVNDGLGTVTRTRIHRSTDDGRTWEPTGAEFSPLLEGGHRQLWTWELGGDGFVYVLSTGFQRDKGVILMRVREEHLADPDLRRWQTWGFRKGAWGWGNPTTIVLPGRIGEMYLRRCEDFWTLTYFDAEHYRIDCRSPRTPRSCTGVRGATSRTVPTPGPGPRGSPSSTAAARCRGPRRRSGTSW